MLRDRASSATEPLPRDGGVRGWRMARPVYVARDAGQQDLLQDYNFQRVVPPPRDHSNFYNTSALDDAAQGCNTTTNRNRLDKLVENLFFDSAAADRATPSSNQVV